MSLSSRQPNNHPFAWLTFVDTNNSPKPKHASNDHPNGKVVGSPKSCDMNVKRVASCESRFRSEAGDEGEISVY